MPVKPLKTIPFLLTLLITSLFNSAQVCATERQNIITDLQYAEAIYYFYLADPLNALTHLAVKDKKPYFSTGHMRAKSIDDLLLETVLKLDYQMTLSAKALLEQENISNEIKHHDKLWLYLAQGFYEKQLFTMAQNSLAKIAEAKNLKEKNLYYFLQLQLALKTADLKPQQRLSLHSVLSKINTQSIYYSYAANNLAIAHYKSKDYNKAYTLLDQAIDATSKIKTQEASQLQQHLLIAAAFMHFYQDAGETAALYFKKLSINSLFIDQALLGFGLLAAEKNKPDLALQLWTQATSYPIASKSKLKSLHNMALLFEKKQQHKKALTLFEKVDQLCRLQLQQLNDIKSRNDDNKLLTQILHFHQVHSLKTTTAIDDNEAQLFNQDLKNNEFLLKLINNDAYLSFLQQHQDLENMRQQLLQWQLELPLYKTIVNSKKLAFRRKQLSAGKQNYKLQATVFNKSLQDYKQKIDEIEEKVDTLALLSPSQQQLWGKIIASEKTITLLLNDPFYADYQEQLKRVKGALIWQAAEQYSEHLWQSKKQLQGLKSALLINSQQQQRFSDAMNNENRYLVFEQQLDNKSLQLTQLLNNISLLQEETLEALQQAFMAQWTLERQAIIELQKSSRISIARVSEHFMQVDYE